MNQNIRRLFDIAQKPERQIIGLMSGTSLDGLDIALCSIKGSGRATKLTLRYFTTMPFSEDFRVKIRRVFAKQTIDFQQLVLLNPVVATHHAELILAALKSWKINPSEIDLIASHGQTVFHAPRILHGLADWPNATLQIGDGDHIAVKTGITTLSDFRQKHIAAGGEGAPLALYGDHLLFSKADENRVLVNIGGIANFTWLPSDGGRRTADGGRRTADGGRRTADGGRRTADGGRLATSADRVFATDSGPGNTLLDHCAQRFFQKNFDENGEIAAPGKINEPFLNALLADPYFEKPVPKTTGPELFGPAYLEKAQKASGTENISPADLMATLTFFSAKTLAEAIKKAAANDQILTKDLTIYLSGGGAHNPVLKKHLAAQLPDSQFFMFNKLGFDGDAKEAILFAVLANEAVAGAPMTAFGLTGQPGVSMGKVSFSN